MDATRYFDAMHKAMSSLHPGAELLAVVKLQDTCGNDAYLEVKKMPGERSAIVCYSTMGRRCLNFQLFRKGWQLCHDPEGRLTGRFPASAESLIGQTDFRAYCRADRLSEAKTDRLLTELGLRAGTRYVGRCPQDARTGAKITVESKLGMGASWTYWSLEPSPCLPVAALLCWLADFLAGNERRTLQADPQAAALAAQWLQPERRTSPALPQRPAEPVHPAAPRTRIPGASPTCARSKSWQSILAVMASI